MFHKYRVVCPKCNEEVIYMGFFFSSAGEVLIDGMCFPCGNNVRFKSTFAEIRFELLQTDRKGNGDGKTN